jgi:hypothetical protein
MESFCSWKEDLVSIGLTWIGDIVSVEHIDSGAFHEFPGLQSRDFVAEKYNSLKDAGVDFTFQKLGPTWSGDVVIETPTEIWVFKAVLA